MSANKMFFPKKISSRFIIWCCAAALLTFFSLTFAVLLAPRGNGGPAKTIDFIVERGDGFLEISSRLQEEEIIRSKIAFDALALFSGAATRLKPGWYRLDPAKSSLKILRELVSGPHIEVAVKIPEGASVYEIDEILYKAGITAPGSVNDYVLARGLEGKLFPDTYKFFTNSLADEVVLKFLDNFELKTNEVLSGLEDDKARSGIVLASMLEKEVPGDRDRRIVAGILQKRIKADFPLQIDATVCYIKKTLAQPGASGCYPLSPLDFKIESEYNTYLYKGLPPGPIGNPGFSAIKAALSPIDSEYWYYLSDPKTGKTIFSKTFDEHNENRAKYLGL